MVSRAALCLALLVSSSPAAAQVTAREIAETADISGITASPDGKWVAYRVERPSTATNRIEVDWYLVPANGEAPPRALGRLGTAMWDDAGSVLPGDAKWSPDSRALVVRALVDGQVALWTTGPDGAGFTRIVAADGDIEAFAFGPDGSLITSEGPSRDAIARAEDAEREAGILVDGSTDLAQPLYRGASINGRPSSQRFSGDWFDRAPLLAAEPRQVALRATLLAPPRSASEEERAALVPPPHPALLMLKDLPAELRTALEAEGVCATKTGCAADLPRLSWWIPRADGGTVVALHDADYRQRLQRWLPAERKLVPLVESNGQLSGGRYYFRPCTAAGDAVFCVEAGASTPPRLVRIGADGAKSVIASPNPNPDSDGLLAETIAWQVSGSRASGILIRPKIPGRLPLFVTYYSCYGYVRGGVGDEWPLRALAAQGIAALCINAVPSKLEGPKRYQLGMEAIQAVVAELAGRGIVDPDRVGMGGLSFGSEVTMWTMMHSKLLKAASIASVQMEPAYYWFNARPGRETFADNVRKGWNVGRPDEDPAGWKRISPALNIDKIGAPLLMQLPESEARLSIELQSKLGLAGLGEMHIFPFAPHLKVEPRQKLAAYQRNLDWFRYWLKGEIDPDPAKAAQYQRWSKLGAKPASAARTQRSTSPISIKRK